MSAELEKNDSKQHSPRQQINKQIGIDLAVSRVRRYVDKENVNADVENACAELRDLIASENPDAKLLSKDTTDLVAKAYETVYEIQEKTKYDELVARLKSSRKHADRKRLKELDAFPNKTESLSEMLDYVGKLRCRFE